MNTPIYLSQPGIVCALGTGAQKVAERLFAGDSSGMQPVSGQVAQRTLTCGVVDSELPQMPSALMRHDTRNNRLLMAAMQPLQALLQQLVDRHGAGRIGVVIGTSTSGILESGNHIGHWARGGELPDAYSYLQQELADPALFLGSWLGLQGPCYSISTACTSGARALISARRLLQAGLCDAVLCGGSDSLCPLTLNGFSSLEAVSDRLCNPFSDNRQGINIGEGAALFLLTREPLAGEEPVTLAGCGASSDAYHISAPSPNGAGAVRAMQQALDDAGLAAAAIDYVNLHGTATRHNDAMESQAMQQLFGSRVACSSSKPMTGHTLGAAGALEAAFCWLMLHSRYNPQALLIPHLWDGVPDTELPAINLAAAGQSLAGLRWLMSNSFAFGGNNTSLILGKAG